MPKAKAPKFYKVKGKLDFELLIEAEDKDEAAEWADQVLPEILKIDTTYSGRVETVVSDITVSKITKVKA